MRHNVEIIIKSKDIFAVAKAYAGDIINGPLLCFRFCQFTKLSTAGHAGAQCHLGYQLTRKGVRTAHMRN